MANTHENRDTVSFFHWIAIGQFKVGVMASVLLLWRNVAKSKKIQQLNVPMIEVLFFLLFYLENIRLRAIPSDASRVLMTN